MSPNRPSLKNQQASRNQGEMWTGSLLKIYFIDSVGLV